jgi:oligopeptidase B
MAAVDASHCLLAFSQVALPDWVLWLQPGINQDYHSRSFRVSLSSPAHQQAAVDVCLATASVTPVAGQHQPAAVSQQQPQQQFRPRAAAQHPLQGISSRRLWAAAPDGTPVPVTLLQTAGVPADGSSPLLVEVYGAYGHMLEADYKPHRLPLLQRGWSVALAHVRGGGELGRR